MVQQVVDTKTFVEGLKTGTVIEPDDVIADNAPLRGKPASKAEPKLVNGEAAADGKKAPDNGAEDPDADDVDWKDGVTPQEKRELTRKMQIAIGKRVRMQKEAEEFAAEQYNGRRLAEQELERLERENRRLQTQIDGASSKDQAEPPQEPKRENFATELEYINAVVDWRVAQQLAAQEAAAQKKAQEQWAEQVRAEGVARVKKAIEMVPDYREVTENADIIVPQHIAMYMQESPMLAELGYYFAKNPGKMEELAKLPVGTSLVALGKIEAILKPFGKADAAPKSNGNGQAAPSQNGMQPSTETDKAPSRPRAGAPITPLPAQSAGQSGKPSESMTYAEAVNDWEKRTGRNLSLRKRH